MSSDFEYRLNQILGRITEDKFLEADGKDIPYYIFDYPPEYEIAVRKHIPFLMEHVLKRKPRLRVTHINLFEFMTQHLVERGYLEQAIELERSKGKDFLRSRLEKLLHPQKTAPLIAELIPPSTTNLVLMSGVGSVWPFLRASSVLNNLHRFTGTTPLVMFYPGIYDQVSFRLFGKLLDKDKQDSYYRAFRLIP